MEGRPVEDTGLRQTEKVANVLGSLVGKSSMVIGPALVSRTARYCASCADVSVVNGTGSGGGVSRMVTVVISIRSRALPSASAGASEILWTTSMPSTTRPKIGVLAIECRLIGNADEELRPGTVRFGWAEARPQPRRVWRARPQFPACRMPSPPCRTARSSPDPSKRIAALDDAEPDDPVKDRAVVRAFARQLDEVARHDSVRHPASGR